LGLYILSFIAGAASGALDTGISDLVSLQYMVVAGPTVYFFERKNISLKVVSSENQGGSKVVLIEA
jgi:hypothetical protein